MHDDLFGRIKQRRILTLQLRSGYGSVTRTRLVRARVRVRVLGLGLFLWLGLEYGIWLELQHESRSVSWLDLPCFRRLDFAHAIGSYS